MIRYSIAYYFITAFVIFIQVMLDPLYSAAYAKLNSLPLKYAGSPEATPPMTVVVFGR